MSYRELLLGCGHSRVKKVLAQAEHSRVFTNVTTVDAYPDCHADIVMDLNTTPWARLPDNEFDEVHAYEVLEHLGSQGDARLFFAHFSEIYRILKPGGYLCGTCPSRHSAWLWGDPSHTRTIQPESFAFLNQEVIWKNRQMGTAMSDFSRYWKGDFEYVQMLDNQETFLFVVRACKPIRAFK